MDDEIDPLMIEVRASTEGFRRDLEAMRGTFNATLVDGFSRAGSVLERGLTGAIRRGGVGFDDLKRVAMQTMNEIAAQAVRSGIGDMVGGGSRGGGLAGGLAGVLTGAVGTLFGLPGRATGGNVSPGSAYVVGERGPEVFVPTSAGRVEASAAPARDVKVSIQLATPRGADAPVALRRSSRQVASSIRRALRDF